MPILYSISKSLVIGCFLLFLASCASTKVPLKHTSAKPTEIQKPDPAENTDPSDQGASSTNTETLTATSQPSFYRIHEVDLKPTNREFRGVWIATIGNIDWPSSSIDPFEKQQQDFIKLLDHYQKMNFNAVIVQIRTAGDAFYPSQYSPWSRYLTGKEGKKPQSDINPLSWMILEAHNRGMEFHAWFNPYRATVDLDTKKLSPEHDFFKHPEWMIKYSTKYYYNPALPEVQQHLTEIIKEVVENYDIDAVHFDDYFYPYVVDKVNFEDGAFFNKYSKPGEKLEDWRRENVNALVKSVHEVIKSTKPWVQFGISPFGVWRNKDKDPSGSNTRAGQTNYDHLFADPITWMKNGWIDYLIPQLYWSMDYNLASYRELIQWWSKNSYNTKIYIGNGPYKIRDNADKAWDNPMEIPNQIALTKATPYLSGNAFFSARSLYQKNKDVSELIVKNYYFQPAFTPEFVGKEKMPEIPNASLMTLDNEYAIQFDREIDSQFRYLVIYSGASIEEISEKSVHSHLNITHLNIEQQTLFPISIHPDQRFLGVSFLDHYGRESNVTVFEIHQLP